MRTVEILRENGVIINAEVDTSGIVNIDLSSAKRLNVTINGESINASRPTPRTQYWQPDGSQGDTPPMDLRGG